MDKMSKSELVSVIVAFASIIVGFFVAFSDVENTFWGIAIVVFGLIAMIGIMVISKVLENKEREKYRAARKAEEQAKIAELNQQAKDGKWIFPAEKFYQLCRNNQATILDNEFSISKALQIAKQLIEAEKIDVTCCDKYLTISSMTRFLAEGKELADQSEAEMIRKQKQPRNVEAPTKEEETFIQRATELAALAGTEKRAKMLSNLSSDYCCKINEIYQGEQALKQLGILYASQQKKENSWAVMGGIAEGIAGPAAGMMAASNTVANNRKIREHNEAMRKASMDIMSGIPSMAGDRYQLEKERGKIAQQLNETKNKVVLSNPAAGDIWKNFKVEETTVEKTSSGVLAVSASVVLKNPFVLDIPENVYMVVDGTIKGEVWFEDNFVGEVLFPLPLYGIPSNMAMPVTLDGMCGSSVEYDGKYTVKIAETQNLWIMEA